MRIVVKYGSSRRVDYFVSTASMLRYLGRTVGSRFAFRSALLDALENCLDRRDIICGSGVDHDLQQLEEALPRF